MAWCLIKHRDFSFTFTCVQGSVLGLNPHLSRSFKWHLIYVMLLEQTHDVYVKGDVDEWILLSFIWYGKSPKIL
jgi:hypothetical protein